MYNKVPITQQIPVYFRKFARINFRESAWKYILFSGIIALIIGAIVDGLGHSGVFVIVSGCIWLGIFNTIQSVCKEHDIINSEYRQGMNIGAYVIAQVLWQAVLCLIQAIVMFIVLLPFGFYSGVDSGNIFLLIMITFYVLIFGASILGLMISCIAGTPTTAMTIMPFVLIVQLLMCDDKVMFELNGVGDVFSCITFSRWGMHALGSLAGLQSTMFSDPHAYGDSFGYTGGSLLLCLLISAVFVVISYFALVIRNKKS